MLIHGWVNWMCNNNNIILEYFCVSIMCAMCIICIVCMYMPVYVQYVRARARVCVCVCVCVCVQACEQCVTCESMQQTLTYIHGLSVCAKP